MKVFYFKELENSLKFLKIFGSVIKKSIAEISNNKLFYDS
jgi:hypothetical protein